MQEMFLGVVGSCKAGCTFPLDQLLKDARKQLFPHIASSDSDLKHQNAWCCNKERTGAGWAHYEPCPCAPL